MENERKEENRISYFQYLKKEWKWPVSAGLLVVVFDCIKNRSLDWESVIGSVIGIFLLTLCCWLVRRLRD